MKVALLTTDTTHHTYYAWKLGAAFPLAAIVLETHVLGPPFETFHPFEARRDEYEREVLFKGFDGTLHDLAETHAVEFADQALPTLRRLAPDAVLVFGTGKLPPPVLDVATQASLNLHGGNPEEYRGLDTHLWTIYHRDFENLVTTLHYANEELDCGDIVSQARLDIRPGTELYQLRSVNTEACVALSLEALRTLEATGSVPTRGQTKKGRYYSFMPALLKDRCVGEFARYVAQL